MCQIFVPVIYNEGLWRINQVTPLHNMQYQPVKLKQYAMKVRQGLVDIVQTASPKYKVTFEELPQLKYNAEDASGLLISVTSSAQDKSKPKEVYSAVLLSWGVTMTLDGASHLPYMLERGEQRVGVSIGFNLVENDSSKSTEQFTLVYRTPQVDHKEKLTLSFDVGDITIIWNGLKDEASNPAELVTLTYQILQNQIFHMIELDVTVVDLCEVILPKAEVKSHGVVKMKTPELINCVFNVLNRITVHDND
ncbi:Cytochrome P450, partial [Operophtera brumata]